jgi:hypothetical protein
MKKNNWFILFPQQSGIKNTWMINNRNDAFDLVDDLELRIFEQFCFLKPKLPIGKIAINFFLINQIISLKVFRISVFSIVVQKQVLIIV